METRVCERCAGELPRRTRVDARYCGGACRVAALRARRAAARPVPAVPRELTSKPRWVRFTAKKVPLRSDGYGPASPTDRSTWSSYDRASASREGVGLGFVLDGDGIACIDLDGCLTDGVLAPWARRIIERVPGAFVEVSVSGRGLHIWGYASVPQGRVVSTPDGGKAEVYGWGRYIAVTGHAFEGSPAVLGNLTDLVAELTT